MQQMQQYLECNLDLEFTKINSIVIMEDLDMYNEIELKQRLIIIKNSPLDDVVILDENYKQLIKNTPDLTEREQLTILRSNAQRRIQELNKSDLDA
jgi:hypothetical protein